MVAMVMMVKLVIMTGMVMLRLTAITCWMLPLYQIYFFWPGLSIAWVDIKRKWDNRCKSFLKGLNRHCINNPFMKHYTLHYAKCFKQIFSHHSPIIKSQTPFFMFDHWQLSSPHHSHFPLSPSGQADKKAQTLPSETIWGWGRLVMPSPQSTHKVNPVR